jgi:pyruvate-formate lyase
MLASSERYCQGDSLGDQWATRVSELFTRIVKEQPVPEGRELIPGWFSWSSTIMYGKQVGATPDGRLAYTPVTHGANPNPGFRKDGAPTSMATGIAKIQPGYGNAAPLQLEMDPHLSAQEGGVEKVMQLIKTHMDMGGTLININVLDKEKLFAAHKNPELYPDLVVRVTGFTAYFAVLSPEFRQLVVDRFVEGF